MEIISVYLYNICNILRLLKLLSGENMNRRQAEHAIKKMLMSGYGHYSRAQEHEIIMSLLQGNQPQLSDSDLGDVEFAHKAITQFPLAEQPLRALKNSLICAVAVMCRYAADLGVDDEKCYALSDYYINEIEARADMNNWGKIHVRSLWLWLNAERTKSTLLHTIIFTLSKWKKVY